MEELRQLKEKGYVHISEYQFQEGDKGDEQSKQMSTMTLVWSSIWHSQVFPTSSPTREGKQQHIE
jgi:hypothetical protein